MSSNYQKWKLLIKNERGKQKSLWHPFAENIFFVTSFCWKYFLLGASALCWGDNSSVWRADNLEGRWCSSHPEQGKPQWVQVAEPTSAISVFGMAQVSKIWLLSFAQVFYPPKTRQHSYPANYGGKWRKKKRENKSVEAIFN